MSSLASRRRRSAGQPVDRAGPVHRPYRLKKSNSLQTDNLYPIEPKLNRLQATELEASDEVSDDDDVSSELSGKLLFLIHGSSLCFLYTKSVG